MLIVQRREKESIKLPGIGEVFVVEIRGARIKIGLDFPQEVKIYRSEVWESYVMKELRDQLPQFSEEEQNALADLLFAEIELDRAQEASLTAAKKAIDILSNGSVLLKLGEDEWKLSGTDDTAYAIKN